MWISLFGRLFFCFVRSFPDSANKTLKTCVINRSASIGKRKGKRRSSRRVAGLSRDELYIALGFGGLLVFALFSKIRAIANLVFLPGNISNIGFYGANPTMTFTVFAQNTAGTAVTVNSFAGNIYCNGTLIGNISSFNQITLPANSQTPVPLNAQLMGISVVSDLISAYSSGSTAQNVEIKGYANGVGFQVPIDLSFSVGG